MNQKPLQIALLMASAAMLCGAGALWSSKNQSAERQNREEAAKLARFDAQVENSRLATSLLKRSTLADQTLSYSAESQTQAFVGGKVVTSHAKVSRAPRHLSIEVLSGAEKGVRSGYSQRWFWRREVGKELVPYAEVRLPADAMAIKRLPLLLRNYRVSLGETKKMDGRVAQLVEMRPKYAVDGAQGPARRLWIDQKSDLTLGIESFNCALQPVSRSSLSKLRVAPPLAPATFEQPKAIFASLSTQNWQGEELGDNFQNAVRKTGFSPPRPAYLPPGFELDGYGVHRCLTTGALQLAAFSRYCDGLNTLTVFAFKPANGDIARTMRGGCNFGSGAFKSREDGGGRLLAMGDLPARTLDRVLASARFETARLEAAR